VVATKHVGSGKVRELFEVGTSELLLVASDRISAYDVVLSQDIPDKGRVLTGLSSYWFDVTTGICPNHRLSVRAEDLPDVGLADVAGRAMLCRRARPIPIEFVVRGYLAGSGWKDYRETGSICGHSLPAGLVESERLPEPLVTPATKASSGHDANITEEDARAIAGGGVYDAARAYALEIYRTGAAIAAERGVLLADTKLEFGTSATEILLIDEVLTPDSSRLWPADSYEPGRAQPSFDKQFVRDWLDDAGWDHEPPAPDLPRAVVEATRARYVAAYELITARPFGSWMKEVLG
jgi:phosphoribosylaminoimidazole-succinocarboxamide synthase